MKKNLYTSRLQLTFTLIYLSISVVACAQWVQKADGIKPRSDLGESIIYKSKLYTFTGFSDTLRHPEPTSEVYDPVKNTYASLAALPANTAMTHQDVILIDNTVWLIGGRLGQNPGPLSSSIWIYNITSNTWSAGPEILNPSTGQPLVMGATGSALLGRTLHIFGGFTPTACENDQDMYHLTLDVDSWLSNSSLPAHWENKLQPLPLKRNHLSALTLAGKIYAIGGQTGHDCGGGLEVAYCHVYNPSTDTWTQLTSLPTGRSHAEGATFAIDGKIYMVGGQNSDGNSSKYVTIFDPSANNGLGKWTEDKTLTLPYVYEGFTAKIIGSTFIVSHGSQGTSKYPLKKTYTRTVVRNPVYKFGFPQECIILKDSSASSLKSHTFLYTIDSTKNYTISSDASWLVISKNATGTATQNSADVEVTANATGLAPGVYSATITATGTGGGTSFTAATQCVNLSIQQNGDVQYSLNVTNSGTGSVSKIPDQATYNAGANVVLTAVAGAGQQFGGWSGDASSTTNPLSIKMNANKNITATFVHASALISNITVTTGRSYVLGQLTIGTTVYTDRVYHATTVPSLLNNAAFIKTANDDKANKTSSMLSFNLSQDATVYIAYDPRETKLPAWMNGWTEVTGQQIGVNDSRITYMLLYSKDFAAGKVILGGNLQSPAKGSLNNYFVLAVAQQLQRPEKITTGDINNRIEVNDIQKNISQHRNFIPGFKVYPNPNHGNKFFIEAGNFSRQERGSIIIQDASGRIIESLKIIADNNGVFKKDILTNKSLSKGIYIIKILSASGNAQRKLIVN